MAAPHPKKRALSDRLKNMRFMKRREETSLREKLIQDQKHRAKDAHWTTQVDAQQGNTTPVVLIEDGISGDQLCARYGRQSFGKFNTVFENDALPPTFSNLPHPDRTNANQTSPSPVVLSEDEKPCKEEPSLAAGFTRSEHSDQEKHPPRHGKSHLHGPRRTIFKKKRKRTASTNS